MTSDWRSVVWPLAVAGWLASLIACPVIGIVAGFDSPAVTVDGGLIFGCAFVAAAICYRLRHLAVRLLAAGIVATVVGLALGPLHPSPTVITVLFGAPWWIWAFARRLRRRQEPALSATADQLDAERGDDDDQERVRRSRKPDLVAQ